MHKPLTFFDYFASIFYKIPPTFSVENSEKVRDFAEKSEKTYFLNPVRIAYFRPTDLVVENKREIPPKKCEKF